MSRRGAEDAVDDIRNTNAATRGCIPRFPLNIEAAAFKFSFTIFASATTAHASIMLLRCYYDDTRI